MQARYARWLWTSVFAIAFLAFGERSFGQSCDSDAECDDGFSCTDNDHCDLGTNTCFFPKNDTLCDDGFSCTDADGCDPANPSADANGCVFPKNDANCDDGFSCTDADGCDPTNPSADANGCVFPKNDANCDDGFSCTDADGCDPTNPSADANGCVFPKNDAPCVDGDGCTNDIGCDPSNPNAEAGTGCLYSHINGCCNTDADCLDQQDGNHSCVEFFCNTETDRCDERPIPNCVVQASRVSTSKKGSILYYSKIELRWNATAPFAPIQNTFLTIVNDYPEEVTVQWYFINGDSPLAATFVGDPPVLSERAHKGCNWVNCTTRLSEDESTYMSALSGLPLGCQPFTILDPSATRPGRPDPENPGQRVLRGYAIAFAVDSDGNEISWNHLSGHVDIVNYADRSAWEYNTYAFQCVYSATPGDLCGTDPGKLHMDGAEYDWAFDKLLFDFYAVGSPAFSLIPNRLVTVNTDLTLYPVSVDLRTDDTDSDGPVITRAKFDVWNQNEDAQSGVNRCISCWDQKLLSNYDAPNSFLMSNLQTNKGKARIDGIESDSCDPPGACCNLNDDPDCDEVDFERGTVDRDCSQNASLLGVSDKILAFSGAVTGRTDAGMTLVGQGTQEATIKRELVAGPDPLTNGLQIPDAENKSGNDASPAPVRDRSRTQHRGLRLKK